MNLKTAKPPGPGYPRALKTIGDHLRKRRLDLGLFQTEVARRLGVSTDCLRYWENNRSSPRFRYLPLIVKFLSYLPYDTTARTLPESLMLCRRLQGLSQRKLARLVGVDPATLARWERGTRQPAPKYLAKINALLSALPAPSSAAEPGG